MKKLNRLKLSPFFLLFFDYELFLVFGIVFGLLVYQDKIKISKSRIFLNLSFLFFLILRIMSAFDNNYSSFWKSLSQKNYALDGKFIDLQSVFLAFNCNSVLEGEYLIYGTEYIYSCPHSVYYGPFFDLVGFKNNPLILSAVLALIVFSVLFIFYLKTVGTLNPKNHYLVTLFALSPPVNFILERMNFDIVIYICVYLIYKYAKNYYLKNALLFLLMFTKFYPVFLIIGNGAFNLIMKNFKKLKIDLIFLIPSLIILFQLTFVNNNMENSARPFRPDRTFGILSESLNFNNLYGWDTLKLYALLVFFLIAVILQQKKFFQYSSILEDQFTFSLITMFLLLSMFANYDYRLAFMILVSIKVINSPNKLLFYSYLFFIFSSPGFLHSYRDLFQLVENYQFIYLDLPFYFLISNFILEFFYFFKKNINIKFF